MLVESTVVNAYLAGYLGCLSRAAHATCLLTAFRESKVS